MKPYKKDFTYSYSIGVYPTLELLKYRPDSLLRIVYADAGRNNEGLQKILEIAQHNHLEIEKADRQVVEISGKENAYVIAVFKKYQANINPEGSHVVLVNPGDTGNLGTIARTMLGFNFRDLAVIKPAVDVFDPKVVRASMGSVLGINVEYFGTFEDYQQKFPKGNFYLFMTSATRLLSEVRFEKPYSLIFGSESGGLPERFSKSGTPVKIAQSKEVDSLNLSTAVGIALYGVSSSAT